MVVIGGKSNIRYVGTFFLSSLGARFLHTYYQTFLKSSEAVAVVVRLDGVPVGFAVGAFNPRGFYLRLLRRRWWAFALASIPALVAHPGRWRRVLRAAQHPQANPEGQRIVGLFSLAVAPSHEGRGVGRALLDAFLSEAARRGGSEIWLATDEHHNERGNNFYRAGGFTLRERRTTPEGRRMCVYGRAI